MVMISQVYSILTLWPQLALQYLNSWFNRSVFTSIQSSLFLFNESIDYLAADSLIRLLHHYYYKLYSGARENRCTYSSHPTQGLPSLSFCIWRRDRHFLSHSSISNRLQPAAVENLKLRFSPHFYVQRTITSYVHLCIGVTGELPFS